MKQEKLDPQFEPLPFIETTVEAARNIEGLVWWRPDGVISATPDSDLAMVKQG